ncbi:MAG: hypothetical protein ABJC26_09850 [Gemmatimonadaceae bacterium]
MHFCNHSHQSAGRSRLRFFSSSSAWLLWLAAIVGCGGGSVAETTTNPIPTPTDTTTHTGTIQRAVLNVQVSIDPNDAALASTLGLGVGGLTVTLQHVGSADAALTALTNSSGVTAFDNLLEGQYSVSIDRFLTATEKARLSAADGDIALLAAGASVNLVAPSRGAVMQLVASRRGSLVLSEFYDYAPNVAGFAFKDAEYFEVYNSSDTTIYLDGILHFRDLTIPVHAQWPEDPCATVNDQLRLDPDGVWAYMIWAFPGRGRDYPLLPGKAAVVAVDAADMTASGTVDLSHAQFELAGGIDNPSSGDMIRLVGGVGAFGHGQPLLIGGLYGLALPVAKDTTSLPASTATNQGKESREFRIPRSAILDVVGVDMPVANYEAGLAYRSGLRACDPWTLPQWDRDRARLLQPLEQRAMRRRSVGRTADGREILQSTGTGSRDFELGLPLQRSLDKPKN